MPRFSKALLTMAAVVGIFTALPSENGRAQSSCNNQKCVGSACQQNQTNWYCVGAHLWVRRSDGAIIGCFGNAPPSGDPNVASGGSCCIGTACQAGGGAGCDPDDPEVACEQ